MKVWPFETGLKALTEADLAGVEVVAAEVYPSLVKTGASARRGEGPGAGARRSPSTSRGWTRPSKLGALFGPDKTTAADVVVEAQHEEGWILGV